MFLAGVVAHAGVFGAFALAANFVVVEHAVVGRLGGGVRAHLHDDGVIIAVGQVRDTATAKPKNYRVLFHDETCKECKLAEYACVCDDAGKEHEKKK